MPMPVVNPAFMLIFCSNKDYYCNNNIMKHISNVLGRDKYTHNIESKNLHRIVRNTVLPAFPHTNYWPNHLPPFYFPKPYPRIIPSFKN